MEFKVYSSESEKQEWDSFVLDNPSGSIFQTNRWLRNISSEVLVCVAEESGTIKFGWAFTKTRKKRINGIHIPPYSPLTGMVGLNNPNDTKEVNKYRICLEEFLKHIAAEKIQDFQTYAAFSEISPLRWHGFTLRPTVTYQICEKEYSLKSIHKSKARQVKKLLGLIEDGDLILLTNPEYSKILELYDLTAKRAGFNPKREILERLLSDQELKENLFSLAITDKSGNYLSGCIAPQDKFRRYHLINASTRSDNSTFNNCNILITYILAIKTLSQGLTLDFEGSMLKGVERFYREMGGQITYRFRSTRMNIPVLRTVFKYL